MAPRKYEEIVTNFSSPTLVLAGPGAGKTYLLADRVKRLLDNGIDNESITVLTFGKDASQHMREELLNQTGHFKIEFKNLPHISTMHSLGFTIVQEKPRYVNLLKTNLKVQADDVAKRLLFRDAALICGFSEAYSKEAIGCKEHGDCTEEPNKKKCIICSKYREVMAKCNRLDFDDQILLACKILEKYPDILEKYQLQSEHLLVDEYQDINAAQFHLIELLSRKNRKGLFTVGDDAQSIYGFRGCDPKFILEFGDNFQGAIVVTLLHSRRCHRNIMEPSFKILKSNYPAWTGEPKLKYHKPDGDTPYIWHLPNELLEAKQVAKVANSAIKEKKEVLILTPKKDFFPILTKELKKRKIPHTCSVNLTPERLQVVNRVIEWVQDPNDNFKTRLVVEDFINTGIAKVPGADKDNRSSSTTIAKRIDEEIKIAKLWESVSKKNDLFSVIKNYANPYMTLAKLQEGFASIDETYYNFKGNNRGEFAKKIAFVSGVWIEPSKMVEDILEVVKILKDEQPTGTGSVRLLTLRKAKGLEADVVIVVGLEDDIMPNPRANNIEEEARLLYVSMTRAKEKLYLFHCFKRPRNISYGPELTKKPRSRFLVAIGRKSEWKGTYKVKS